MSRSLPVAIPAELRAITSDARWTEVRSGRFGDRAFRLENNTVRYLKVSEGSLRKEHDVLSWLPFARAPALYGEGWLLMTAVPARSAHRDTTLRVSLRWTALSSAWSPAGVI